MGEVLGSKIKNNRHADIIRFVKSQNTVSENTDFFCKYYPKLSVTTEITKYHIVAVFSLIFKYKI